MTLKDNVLIHLNNQISHAVINMLTLCILGGISFVFYTNQVWWAHITLNIIIVVLMYNISILAVEIDKLFDQIKHGDV